MVGDWVEIVASYPPIPVEDGLGADDWEGWQSLQQPLRDRLQVAGDDLLVSNIERRKAIDTREANLVPGQLQPGRLTHARAPRWKEDLCLQAALVVRSEASLIDH
jgi:enolase